MNAEKDETRERVVALVADLADTLSDPTQAWDIAVADFNHALRELCAKPVLPPGENDLPSGYRWATAEEVEDNVPGIIVVPRTTDASGSPYTQDEADLAVPTECNLIREGSEHD